MTTSIDREIRMAACMAFCQQTRAWARHMRVGPQAVDNLAELVTNLGSLLEQGRGVQFGLDSGCGLDRLENRFDLRSKVLQVAGGICAEVARRLGHIPKRVRHFDERLGIGLGENL